MGWEKTHPHQKLLQRISQAQGQLCSPSCMLCTSDRNPRQRSSSGISKRRSGAASPWIRTLQPASNTLTESARLPHRPQATQPASAAVCDGNLLLSYSPCASEVPPPCLGYLQHVLLALEILPTCNLTEKSSKSRKKNCKHFNHLHFKPCLS